MNLPNKLTVLRIIMTPIFIAAFYLDIQGWNIIAAVIYCFAFITDILDGAIARKYNMVTDFGKLVDPIADKILTVSALIMLTANGDVSPIATIVIISREFLVSAIRMIALTSNKVVAASNLGKAKTVIQTITILVVFVAISIEKINFIAQILIWLSVLITVVSGVDYFKKNVKSLTFK